MPAPTLAARTRPAPIGGRDVRLDAWLAVCGVLGLAAMLGSKAIEHLPVTGPLVALLLGAAIGPDALGLVEADHELTLLHGASEVLLAISLVAVALRYPVRDLRTVVRPSALLATVGMVGTALAGGLIAWWVLDLEVEHALLLGAILAPTDPVLASSVITGDPAEEALPGRLRRTLSTESGANDGLGWPLVLVGIALVVGHDVGPTLLEIAYGLVVAVAVGVVVGWSAGRMVGRLDDLHELEPSALFVAALALAVAVLGLVNLAGGDGVLGVFAAGLAYNRAAGESTVAEEREVEEGVNQLLVLPLFVLLGVVLPWGSWGQHWVQLVLFLLALTALRRLPVVFALRRAAGIGRLDAAFLGWFGPAGVASLFYLAMSRIEGVRDPLLWAAATAAIAFSTVLYGATAAPGRALYQRLARR